MNGAESLLRTLVHSGIEVCFANPGTSEMHFVAAVDRIEGMRCIPGLFEGVVSGAADGYARMTDKPAATLLHLGPGLANALANFHNARRAQVPIVNIVGDHASYHQQNDPPLHSDIKTFAKPVSGWIGTAETAMDIPPLACTAIKAAYGPPGQIATLILPADCSWGESAEPIKTPVPGPEPTQADDVAIQQAAAILRSGQPSALLLKGRVLRAPGLALAGQISAKTKARIMCDTFNTRIERGAGRAGIEHLPYFPEPAMEFMHGLEHLILVGAQPPVSFFAYPGTPVRPTPEGCEVHILTSIAEDGVDALQRLADETGAGNSTPVRQALMQPALPTGDLDPQSIAQAVACLLPENAVVVDEAISSSLPLLPLTATAPAHDWLTVTGGAIGQGLPTAAGAAIACPDRRIICLEADGSGMYTVQSLWTYARESLNITTVIYANQEYRILKIEHQRAGAGAPGPRASDLISLSRPQLDWVKIAAGMGVPACRVTTTAEFSRNLQTYLNEPGPNLIEAVF